ncbi:MAG: hypothetical protein JXB48_02635 [Candidatus Latescibacteria bacterium]|nr:hypothetical protein [Candidatus Latescibacterota bacterium]
MYRICVFGFIVLFTGVSNSIADERKTLVLENDQVIAVFDLGGGALADFSFKDQRLNPLAWHHPAPNDTTPQPFGHFLCFDRLGNPSPQEKENGMPFHGEASKIFWHESAAAEVSNDDSGIGMKCELPLAKMSVNRFAVLSKRGPVLQVKEVFTNVNLLGRVCNILQHPSIGGLFLDEIVLVDSNAWKGFSVGNPMPMVEEPLVYWHTMVKNGSFTDLRKLVSGDNPGVESFICRKGEKFGWITACNPKKGLLIGYIWLIEDYPWIRHWRHIVDGIPQARGLEFGTTPLPLPFGDILKKHEIFGTPIFVYLDSNESIEKSFTVFLMNIPVDFRGVKSVEKTENKIELYERETGKVFTVTF